MSEPASRFRCPYCLHVFARPEPGSLCPSCRRTVIMPAPSGPSPRRAPARPSWTPPHLRDGRKPRPALASGPLKLLIALAFLLILGANLMVQLAGRRQPDPAAPATGNAYEGPSFLRHMIRATAADAESRRQALARRNLAVLMVALDQFAADCGDYPATPEGLVSLIHNPGHASWQGPYIVELLPDPWGVPFRYARDESDVRVCSSGPDRTPETDDDIVHHGQSAPATDGEEVIRARLLSAPSSAE